MRSPAQRSGPCYALRMPASPRGSAPKALLATLVLSLAGNAYLSYRVRFAAPPAPPTHTAATAAASSPAPCADARAAELEAYRRAMSALPLPLWGSAAPPDAAPRPVAADSPPQAPGAGPQDLLCRLARDKLRDQWLEKKDSISQSVARDIPDAAKQRSDAERDAQTTADRLGLSGRARATFEGDYVDMRTREMAALAGAASSTPIDWQALLGGAQAIWREEDALVERDVGAQAAASFRESDMTQRLTLLSILATYAGADWETAANALVQQTAAR